MNSSVSPLMKALKKALLPLRGERVLLAFSGGLDSLALGQALSELASEFQVSWDLAHIHHGSTINVEQAAYREKAASAAKEWADRWNVTLHLSKSDDVLRDREEAARDFRYAQLELVRQSTGANKILLAHHHDDLLETRVMRLLRGTGPRGLVAMETESTYFLRPWLEQTRAEIETFAQARHLCAIEDPSNKNSTYFRNWIRNDWLPQLEAKQPGALVTLARSLENLASAHQSETKVEAMTYAAPHQAWDRRQFRDLSSTDRKRAVAEKLRSLGARNYTKTHVEEIVKRLDTVQKRLDFTVAGVEFRLNAQQIHSSIFSGDS